MPGDINYWTIGMTVLAIVPIPFDLFQRRNGSIPDGSVLMLGTPALVALVACVLFACMCGELGWRAFIVSTASATAAWYSFARLQSPEPGPRTVAMVATITCSFVLVKAVLDIGWGGHIGLFA